MRVKQLEDYPLFYEEIPTWRWWIYKKFKLQA